MTAVSTYDLTWVEFSEREDQVCDTQVTDCSNQATWRAHFHTECEHIPSVHHYCESHMIRQLAVEATYGESNPRVCGRCRGAVELGAVGCPGRLWITSTERLGG